MNRLNLLEGAAVGASVVYLLDPHRGRARRRALVTRVGIGARAALEATVSRVEGRIGARARSSEPTRSLVLRRARRHPANTWDIPMTTVNIDVDQGTVTLRGTFPSVLEPPLRAAGPHRGFTRARIRLVPAD